ncbi:MAG: outer membrane lipoprotein-sorting protein [Bacteroidia bacterium]|jgi:outer membrane lipoprotein-sorting protein
MFRTLPLFLLILFPFFLSAQDWKTLSADDSKLTELRSALANMESIKGDIKQEKGFSFLTEKLVSEGVFLYQNESKLRWEFKEPIEYIILINDNSMRLKEEGEEKKYKGMNQILRQVKEIILGCINGSIMINSNYKTSFFANETDIRILLQPKAKNLKEFIEQIEVEFSTEGSTLQKVTLTDPSGDMTDIRFSNIVVNEKIDAAAFADF